MQGIVRDSENRPTAPYVGVRSYGFDETVIFSGRDDDVAHVGALVARRTRWRVILMHGQTGCGKSSFLKAGLIPALTSPRFHTDVFDKDGDGSFASFINATDNPIAQIAVVAVRLAREGIPAADLPEWLHDFGVVPDLEEAAPILARKPALLVRWLERLAPCLDRPLLLVVDQAEEVFTLSAGPQSESAIALFFDFLAAYCERSTWIQFLISMRTEFYGRYDHELRRRMGPQMPVAPYYLQPFSIAMLEIAVIGPLNQLYRTPNGYDYRVKFEPGVARALAETIAHRFPGPGALTCLQIVCVRLCSQALVPLRGLPIQRGIGDAAPPTREVSVTRSMLNQIGAVEIVVEDLIDQVIGDFCEINKLNLFEACQLWFVAKDVLCGLVARQADGAPTTKFSIRGKFINELDQRLIQFIAPRHRYLVRRQVFDTTIIHRRSSMLVEYLLNPDVRVLREVKVTEPGQSISCSYLALGHDVLCVSLAEAAARTSLIKQRNLKRIRLSALPMLGVLLLSMIGAGLALFFSFVSMEQVQDYAVLAFLVTFSWWIWQLLPSGQGSSVKGWFRLIEQHIANLAPEGDETPAWKSKYLAWVFRRLGTAFNDSWLQEDSSDVLFSRIRSRETGKLFRSFTADKRREAVEQGKRAFPGSTHY